MTRSMFLIGLKTRYDNAHVAPMELTHLSVMICYKHNTPNGVMERDMKQSTALLVAFLFLEAFDGLITLGIGCLLYAPPYTYGKAAMIMRKVREELVLRHIEHL